MSLRREQCRIDQEQCADRAPVLIVGGLTQHLYTGHNVLDASNHAQFMNALRMRRQTLCCHTGQKITRAIDHFGA